MTEKLELKCACGRVNVRALPYDMGKPDDCDFCDCANFGHYATVIRPTPAAPVADREPTTSTVDDRGPAVRGAQADVLEAMARALSEEGAAANWEHAMQCARAAYAAAEEAWTRQVVEWRTDLHNMPRNGNWFWAYAQDSDSLRLVKFWDEHDRLPFNRQQGAWTTLPTHWMPSPHPPAIEHREYLKEPSHD